MCLVHHFVIMCMLIQCCHGEVVTNVSGAHWHIQSLLELECFRASPQDYEHSELLIMVGMRLVSLHNQPSIRYLLVRIEFMRGINDFIRMSIKSV